MAGLSVRVDYVGILGQLFTQKHRLATRLPYTHFHPVFSPTDPSIECPKHWYKNVFMLNSFFGSMCMVRKPPLFVSPVQIQQWTWYISAEFFFYLLSPLFLITLYRSQFEGILLIIGTIFLSSSANTWTMYVNKYPPIPLR